MKFPIYMDHHATTPVDPRVFEAMRPYFTEKFGNAASRSHAFGWEAEEAVSYARNQVAKAIGAVAKEIVFTSGATESINLALKGVAGPGHHVVTAETEHTATLDSLGSLEKQGVRVTFLRVDRYGKVDPQDVLGAITEKTVLISLMHANNEIGTLQPIERVGAVAKEKGILFHVDASQTFGKLSIDVRKMGIDLLSLSGHKIYGPKGVGALYVRGSAPRVRLAASIHGGGHENGFRSGTLNVPAIVGLGKAAEIAFNERERESEAVGALRDRLHRGLERELDGIFLNGHATDRLYNNLNLSFAEIEAEALMMGLKQIAVSSGSACASASREPSYVLRAIGVPEELAHGSLRFGLGRFNTEEEIDFAIEKVAFVVRRLRDMPLAPIHRTIKETVSL